MHVVTLYLLVPAIFFGCGAKFLNGFKPPHPS